MSVRERVDRFWARYLGAAVEPGIVKVVPHAALAGYRGVWLFVRGAGAVVSAPPAWVPRLSEALEGVGAAELHAVAPERLGGVAERFVGPSYLGALDPARFRPAEADRVRPLGPGDAGAVAQLREATDPTDWQHADLRLEASEGSVGAFAADGRLLAAASLSSWGSDAVGPGVFTHPGRRGRGLGCAVVSAVCAHALAADRLVVYQTLRVNRPAVAIAATLGFEDYATNLAVRLRP